MSAATAQAQGVAVAPGEIQSVVAGFADHRHTLKIPGRHSLGLHYQLLVAILENASRVALFDGQRIGRLLYHARSAGAKMRSAAVQRLLQAKTANLNPAERQCGRRIAEFRDCLVEGSVAAVGRNRPPSDQADCCQRVPHCLGPRHLPPSTIPAKNASDSHNSGMRCPLPVFILRTLQRFPLGHRLHFGTIIAEALAAANMILRRQIIVGIDKQVEANNI